MISHSLPAQKEKIKTEKPKQRKVRTKPAHCVSYLTLAFSKLAKKENKKESYGTEDLFN